MVPKDKTKIEEYRRKLSEASKGNKAWTFKKTFGLPKGKHHWSEEHKRKISEANKGVSRNKGEKNGMFKHGKYGIRRVIFEDIKMDKECESCKSSDRIEIHHKNSNSFDNEIKNIMVLCRSCHSKQHRTKEQMAYVRSFK